MAGNDARNGNESLRSPLGDQSEGFFRDSERRLTREHRPAKNGGSRCKLPVADSVLWSLLCLRIMLPFHAAAFVSLLLLPQSKLETASRQRELDAASTQLHSQVTVLILVNTMVYFVSPIMTGNSSIFSSNDLDAWLERWASANCTGTNPVLLHSFVSFIQPLRSQQSRNHPRTQAVRPATNR